MVADHQGQKSPALIPLMLKLTVLSILLLEGRGEKQTRVRLKSSPTGEGPALIAYQVRSLAP